MDRPLAADGSGKTSSTVDAIAAQSWYSYTADGSKLGIVLPDDTGHRDVYTERGDGSGRRPLTALGTLLPNVMNCQYSPDGSEIAILYSVDAPYHTAGTIFIEPDHGGGGYHLLNSTGFAGALDWR